MLVVIYQLTVMTIEIHMDANISQVATRNKMLKLHETSAQHTQTHQHKAKQSMTTQSKNVN